MPEKRRTLAQAGFLSDDMEDVRKNIAAAHCSWFRLARNISDALHELLRETQFDGGNSLDQKNIATCLLLRTLTAFQNAIVLLEGGATSSALTLARGCLEDGLAMTGLIHNPADFIDRLTNDYKASRSGQIRLALSGDWAAPADQDALQETLAALGRGKMLKFDELKGVDRKDTRYLLYRMMSGHAVHCSADSLQRYMVIENDKWTAFRFGPDDPERIPSAMRYTCLAALPVGVQFAELFGDDRRGDHLSALLTEAADTDVPVDWFHYPSKS